MRLSVILNTSEQLQFAGAIVRLDFRQARASRRARVKPLGAHTKRYTYNMFWWSFSWHNVGLSVDRFWHLAANPERPLSQRPLDAKRINT